MKLISVEVFENGSLSNEDYHGEKYADHISGSGLAEIHETCPAKWKFKDPEEHQSQALHFGTASHAAILEPDLFDKQFICGISKEDFPDAATSDAGIKSQLKERGITGYSKFTGVDLLAFCAEKAPDIDHFQTMEKCFYAANKDKTIVDKGSFEAIQKMRRVLFADPANVELMTGASIETSLICQIEINNKTYKVKIRPDVITKNCEVPDYKTTVSAEPEAFGRQAHNAGYWLKQAFVCDVLAAVYGTDFKPGLLAQEKKSPFIHQLYWLTPEQIQVGREQYTTALEYWGWCSESSAWPAYSDGPMKLHTPGYLAKRYGFEQ